MSTSMHMRWALALAAILTPSTRSSWAQETAPPPASNTTTAPTTENEEVVFLSPFTVDTAKDKGYRVTNSISGTRLNTAIKDVPLNLEVITNDFMRDTGATDLREALRYSSGVVLESQSDAFTEDDGNRQSAGANDPRGITRKEGDSTTKLRGFVIEQVLRDGFRRQYSADWINIERVEVLRGPSALLYGVGSFGGVINYIPKRPQFTPSYYAGVTIGTEDFYRGEFDFTGPLGTGDTAKKMAYRLTGAYQTRQDYSDFYRSEHFAISPSFSFQPFENTTVLFDNEFGHTRQDGVGFQNIRTNIGTQVSDGDHSSRGATWLTDEYDLTTGLKIGENVDNRTFRWSGPDTYLKGPFWNSVVDVTQRIGEDFFLKIGVAESEATFDSRQIDGNTHPIRGTFSAAEAARAAALYGTVVDSPISKQSASASDLAVSPPNFYTDGVIAYSWVDYDRKQKRAQARVEATYKLDLGRWGTHTVLAGTQYMRLREAADEYGTAYSYTNQWGGSAFVANSAHYSYKNPNDYTPFRYGVQGDGLADPARILLYRHDKRTWDLGYYAVYHGQFFDERLNLIGGLRRDRSDAHQFKHYIYESSHPSDYQGLGAPGGTVSAVPEETSPQVGLSFALNRNLTVFGLYSTGMVPNYYSYDGFGNMMAPTKAKNHEVGLKFDLSEGRISGTISAYKLEREGQPKFLWWAPSPFESIKKGYDPAKPGATVAWYAMPSSLWHAIHETAGKTVAQGATIAKQIYPTGWHALIDEIAAAPTEGDAWAGPLGSTFWNYAWMAEGPTANPQVGDAAWQANDFYFPLVNLSDPDVAAFMGTIATLPGWNGNYFYDAGKPYRFGNGTLGTGNAANGSGASVPMNDEALGWDASLVLTPTDKLQFIFNFAHVDRKITTNTYQFVTAPYFPFAPWFASDNNYGSLDSTKTAPAVYADVFDTSTYNQVVPDYNEPGDDTPKNSASVWMRLSLDVFGERFTGWNLGLGGQWEDKRLWFSGFSGGGSNFTLVEGTRELVKLYTDDRYTFNAMLEYNKRIADRYDWRVALNVNNLTNDKDLYGLVHASGMSARLTSSIKF